MRVRRSRKSQARYSRFAHDDDAQVRSVLRDLCESKLVFSSGTGASTVYRAAPEEELGALWRLQGAEGFDELLWVLVYRDGPLTLAELVQQVQCGRVDSPRSACSPLGLRSNRVHRKSRGERPLRAEPADPLGLTRRLGGGCFRSLQGHGEHHHRQAARGSGCSYSLGHSWRQHVHARHLARTPARERGLRYPATAPIHAGRASRARRERQRRGGSTERRNATKAAPSAPGKVASRLSPPRSERALLRAAPESIARCLRVLPTSADFSTETEARGRPRSSSSRVRLHRERDDSAPPR